MSEEPTVQDLTMEHFEIIDEVWNSLPEKTQKALIKVYMETKRPARTGAPETDRVCEFKYIEDGKVVFCKSPSTYRITKCSDYQVLQDDGEWKTERTEEYLCKNHYDRKYLWNEYCTSKDLGIWTFRRFDSSIKEVEKEGQKEKE